MTGRTTSSTREAAVAFYFTASSVEMFIVEPKMTKKVTALDVVIAI